jgi:nicotinate-nucleotide adenylyltransferase
VTGILGGTFDPVHLGHLAAATSLLGQAGLEEVWLMPNARPVHRANPPMASPEDRLRMVELAVLGRPGLRASALEVERGGPSFTIDTLEALRRADPSRPIRLLLGFDAALQIRSWHRAQELLEEAHFVIFSRPSVKLLPAELDRLGFPAGRTRVASIETPSISAETVRRRLAAGEPVDGMLSAPVLAYIREHRLYQGPVG